MRRILYFLLRRLRVFDILQNQKFILQKQEEHTKNQREILNAHIFNSTIADSEWLKFKSFSPGVWAADYGLLYTLYRVLNGMKPQSILEFGLGQSSKLLHQYANFFSIKAITCEHDLKWVKFFNEGRDGKYSVNVKMLDLEEVEYKEQKTISYKDANKLFQGEKFELIVVDAPFGSEHYSRSQIIELSKRCLAERFCIIIDDYERQGEKETVKELFDILDQNNVQYYSREYCSSKSHILICSPELNFLTTL